ncbi:MAG: hypothetical protein WBD40_14165 [Tepidisphaeraceae bacterium]
MTAPNTLSIDVELTNPGQFFACCGVLELASRLNDQAVGWFADGQFSILNAPQDVVERFLDCEIYEAKQSVKSMEEEDKKSSLRIGSPFNLTLDWWREHENPDSGAVDAKLKTWSAGMKVSDVFDATYESKVKKGATTTTYNGLRGWMSQAVRASPTGWLRDAFPINSPKAFNYDSRLSRNNALDLGHTSGAVFAFSPAIDVLALVGLQRFRPKVLKIWTRNLYFTWRIPLPVDLAAVAAQGVVPQLIDSEFEFAMVRRDSKGNYKLVGHAQPVRRSNG